MHEFFLLRALVSLISSTLPNKIIDCGKISSSSFWIQYLTMITNIGKIILYNLKHRLMY